MIYPVKNQNLLFAGLASLFLLTLVASYFTGQLLLLGLPFGLVLFYLGWQYPSAIFFFMLLSLPLSFEFSLASGLATDVPDEFLMIWTTVLSAGIILYKPRTISNTYWRHPLFILSIVWVGWIFITACFSSQPVLSFKYFLAKTWYVGAFLIAPFVFFQSRQAIKYAGIAIVSSMMIVVLIALSRHEGNNFTFVSINASVTPFFRNHVNYSAMLVCIVPILIAFFLLSKKNRLLVSLLLAVSLFAIFFAYARGAWLALAIGSFTYVLIRIGWLLRIYVLSILIILGALFWVSSKHRYIEYAPDYKTTIFHKDFKEHLAATYKLKDMSTAERIYRWIAGIRMIRGHELTGYGPNTFYEHYKPYAVPAFKTWVSDNKEQSTVHNYFLLIAIEQGLPGLLFFVLLLGAVLYYAQRLYKKINEPFYKTVAMTIGVIAVMIAVVNFLSDLIETDKIGSLFFLCISILMIVDIKSSPERLARPSTHSPVN